MNKPKAKRRHNLNPNYGKGIFRRRILLTGTDNLVVAQLEDCNHGFKLKLSHNNEKVTALEAQALRYPLSTCSMAVEPLQSIVGCPLSPTSNVLAGYAKAKSNCTHLFDLAALAISHALRGQSTRQYDVEVPDAVTGDKMISVKRDQQLIHQWTVNEHIIQTPKSLAGNPVMKGFYQWASQTFSGEDWEAVQVLQRGYFVSRARAVDLDGSAGKSAVNDTYMLGMCYSYSPGVVENAIRSTQSVRDFSHCPEQLLAFK
jgi:hypothetical protein